MALLDKVDPQNYSEYVPTRKIHTLKKTQYDVIPDISVGGDAPKDILQIYFYKQGLRKKKRLYIAKAASKWYPVECITEFLMTRLGQLMGFNVANGYLIKVNNEVRFCSEYFLNRKKQRLIHAAEMHSGYLNDQVFIDKVDQLKIERNLISYQFCLDSINYSFSEDSDSIIENFNLMLLHDAIIGNNDRHMFNWGIVKYLKEDKNSYLSPFYDTARGLF